MSPAIDPSSKFTYLGTLDDMVAKYPWGYSIDLKFLNATLASSALFGNKVIFPDGYLMNLLVARKALITPESSSLSELIYSGQVVVVSRLDDLSRIPEEMQKKGVASFPDLLQSSDWFEFRNILERLTRRLSDGQLLWRWPKQDMGAGFKSTILKTQGKNAFQLGLNFVSQDILNETFDVYQETMVNDNYAARTRWENAVKLVAKKRLHHKVEIDRAILELMFLGNEAYHYNFTGCLAATLGHPISLETRFSSAFADFVDVSSPLDRYLERFYPKILPKGFPTGNGKLLSEVVTPGTLLNDAKNQYLESLKCYSEGRLDFGQVESDANHYSRLLSQHFYGDKFSERWKLGISFTANVIMWLADPDLSKFSLASRFGVNALMWYMDQHIPPFIVHLFQAEESVPDHHFFEPRKERELALKPAEKPIKKMLSLTISERSVKSFFKKIPKFGDKV